MVGMTASALMGVMNPLLGKLSTLLEREYSKLKGVRRQIAFLRDELSSMNTALEMVTESEEASPYVKEWMSQLRELSYDVGDCIENFMQHLGHDGAYDGFIQKITSRVIALKARHHIGDRINDLKERASEINNRRRRYEFNPSASSSKSVVIDPRLPAIFEEADRLVGIDSQKDELVKWLTDGIDLNPQHKVVSIVGSGGLGKTTLANQAFQQIRSQFDCTAFVSVSRSPNVQKILTDALLQLLKTSSQITDDQNRDIEKIKRDLDLKTLEYLQLVNMTREYLQNKRYFVVIDDIWSKQAWKEIQCAFLRNNNNASRIMTTTRIQGVAESCTFPHKDCVFPMKPLDKDNSKRLFLKRIFDHEDDCPLELKKVTDDILKKCDGLPLAIVNIASLLATKPTTKQEWERLRNSLCSALEQDPELEVVKRILFLSYYDLPHYLKICLLDLSIFPEDFEINCERLIRRWMAEGFIVGQRGQCLKDTGRNCISELINRNMIQPVDIDYISGRPRACRVHDIMLDLIISLSTKENFVTIMNDQRLTPSTNKIRRLSIQGKYETRSLRPGTNKLSHVRSLTVFNDVKMPPLLDFQVLRVLDLQDSYGVEDGDIRNIGCLIHLRYLSLRSSTITEIPRQIGKLQHLQTLSLVGTNIKELPATVVQLRQLVRLSLDEGVKLPIGIGNMESLEELCWFDVRGISPDVVLELGNMTNLKVLGIIWCLDGAASDEGSYQKSLISSLCKLGEHNIRNLHIMTDTSGSIDFLVDSWCPPPRHLQTFRMLRWIEASYLSRLPRWISSLSELTCLEIYIEQVGGGDVQVLRDLPSLLSLVLGLKETPKETLVISPSGFQSLKDFVLNTMDGLDLMFEQGAMPKLEDLWFDFAAHDTLSAYGVDFDFGIRHLTSLKHLWVRINCRGARSWEVEAAEAAIRNAAALLPYHPTPGILRLFEKEMVKDEEQREDTDGAEEEHAAEQEDGASITTENSLTSSIQH